MKRSSASPMVRITPRCRSYPAHVVDQGKVGDIVEQGIDREVPAQGILFRVAEDVVTQDHAGLVDRKMGWSARRLAPLRHNVGCGRPLAPLLRLLLRLTTHQRAEGGHFDQFILEVQVGQPETTPHQAAVAKDPLDLAWRRIGYHVEVLGFAPQPEVADAAPHQISPEALGIDPVEGFEGVGADECTGDGVVSPGDEPGGSGQRWGNGGTFGHGQASSAKSIPLFPHKRKFFQPAEGAFDRFPNEVL